MNQFLLENMLNVWIVKLGGRPACLIETCHSHFDMKHLEYLNKFANMLGLAITHDPLSLNNYPRFAITQKNRADDVRAIETSSDLGRLLGMSYLKDDFGDYMSRRSHAHIYAIVTPRNVAITKLKYLFYEPGSLVEYIERELYWQFRLFTKPIKVNLFAEVSKDCDALEKNTVAMCIYWNSLLEQYGGLFGFDIQIGYTIGHDDGVTYRAMQLYNDEYFMEHYLEYANDVWNFCDDDMVLELFTVNAPKWDLYSPDAFLAKYREAWYRAMRDVV
jgi:hypothetical protein